MRHLMSVLLAVCALGLGGCTGDAGPQGPQGVMGPPGPPGSDGSDGNDLADRIVWSNNDPLGLRDVRINITNEYNRKATPDRFLMFYAYAFAAFPGDDPETEGGLMELPFLVENERGETFQATGDLFFDDHERVFFRFRHLQGFYVTAVILFFTRP